MADQDYFNVRDYGAVGTGDPASDDTAAFAAAIAAAGARGGGTVFVPAGTYMIGPGGLTLQSGVEILGAGHGGSWLRVKSSPTAGLFNAAALNGIGISKVTLDFQNFSTFSGVVDFQNCADFYVRGCRLVGIGRFGIVVNGGSNFEFSGNVITLTTAAATQNEGILISSSAGLVYFGRIVDNVLQNTGMDIACSYTIIAFNLVSGWKFGGGITTEQGGSSNTNLIIANVVTGGIGTDANNTIVSGIENWAPYSVIACNLLTENAGDGLDQGGAHTAVTGNVIFNNGRTGGSGIVGRSGAGYTTSFSAYVGNVAFDTGGPSGSQQYGYVDQTPTASQYTAIGTNVFSPNVAQPVNVSGAYYDQKPPSLVGSVTGIASFTLANGQSAQVDATVAASTMGDLVAASYSQDLQGVRLFGWVMATNAVRFRFENNTGAAVTIAAGSIYYDVTKRAGYATY